MAWIKFFRCLALVLPLAAVPEGSLYAQVPFYQGKTVTLIVSSDPGGTSDLRVKSLVPYIQKYIPGNPTVVIDYMPGGGGRKAANHVFRTAKPDGLFIGSMGTTLLAAVIQGESGVLYDVNKFIYLGSSDAATQHVFSTRKEVGLTNLEKLRGASGIRIGAQAIGHSIYITGRLFAFFLGLKDPKFVVGYSGPEVDLALLRGEVDARSSLVAAIVQRSPEWIDKGLVDFHAVLETPKGNRHPRFAHLPELETFAKSERERKVWRCSAPFVWVARPSFYHRTRREIVWRFCKPRCAKRLTTRRSLRHSQSLSAKIRRRSCPRSCKRSSKKFLVTPR